MELAFYRGRQRRFDCAVQWYMRGHYSHCEIVFGDGLCGSASRRDGGVRVKRIDFKPDRWDRYALTQDEASVREWFERHDGQGYDLLGLLGFFWRPFTGDAERWFCSEACAAALGLPEPWRFCPNTLAASLRGLRGLDPGPAPGGRAEPARRWRLHRRVPGVGGSADRSTASTIR